ncbi:MAG: hypothetical protein AVDCRST_MAG79-374, partial [uncultured Thermoleophilia bacterium]
CGPRRTPASPRSSCAWWPTRSRRTTGRAGTSRLRSGCSRPSDRVRSTPSRPA